METTLLIFMVLISSIKGLTFELEESDDVPICDFDNIPSDDDDVSEEAGVLSEDGRLDFSELAAKYGFPTCEDKNVITEDGYVLRMQHIPGDPKRPVLLAHGNTAGSSCWIDRGNISLAITLARRGYDVWAINFRGTTLSRRNLYLNADAQEQAFYNYSFYEQGYYDLPATIDVILNATNQSQLLAIGHSVGTTNFYVLGSERPEYNDKIKAFISLAPISFLQHEKGLASLAIATGQSLPELAKIFGVSQIVGKNEISSRAFVDYCLGPDGYKKCVEGILFPSFGYDRCGFEPAFMRTFFGHFPSGTSVKLMNHTIQIAQSGRFAKYDYGVEGNLAEYGTAEPPEFDLSKATMKMALFVGREDYLATVKDAEHLRRVLPNVVHYKILPYRNFNHIDFIWGQYMPSNLYPFLLPVIEKYI